MASYPKLFLCLCQMFSLQSYLFVFFFLMVSIQSSLFTFLLNGFCSLPSPSFLSFSGGDERSLKVNRKFCFAFRDTQLDARLFFVMVCVVCSYSPPYVYCCFYYCYCYYYRYDHCYIIIIPAMTVVFICFSINIIDILLLFLIIIVIMINIDLNYGDTIVHPVFSHYYRRKRNHKVIIWITAKISSTLDSQNENITKDKRKNTS